LFAETTLTIIHFHLLLIHRKCTTVLFLYAFRCIAHTVLHGATNPGVQLKQGFHKVRLQSDQILQTILPEDEHHPSRLFKNFHVGIQESPWFLHQPTPPYQMIGDLVHRPRSSLILTPKFIHYGNNNHDLVLMGIDNTGCFGYPHCVEVIVLPITNAHRCLVLFWYSQITFILCQY